MMEAVYFVVCGDLLIERDKPLVGITRPLSRAHPHIWVRARLTKFFRQRRVSVRIQLRPFRMRSHGSTVGSFEVIDEPGVNTDPDSVRFTNEVFQHVEIFITGSDGLRKFLALPIEPADTVFDIHHDHVDMGAFAFGDERTDGFDRLSGLRWMGP